MNSKKTWKITWDYVEQIIDAAHELFLILDKDLKVVKANDRFYQFFKAKEEETEGKIIYQLGDGQWDIKKLKLLLDAILAEDSGKPSAYKIVGGHFDKFIVDYKFPNIGRKTLVLNAKKIYRPSDKSPMILISMQDATSQKELEEVLMSVGNGLIVTNKDGKIVMVNKAFEKLLGWKQDEVLQKNMVDVVPMEDEASRPILARDRAITQVLAGQRVVQASKNYFFITKDNKKLPVSAIASPIIISNEVTGAVEIFRDLTEERELDKAKTEFVSIASHQLRTPLSTINWYTEMMLNGRAGKVGAKQKKYINEIVRGSKRMVMLVNSLLNVSRLELGNFMIQPEETNIKEIADSVLHDLKMQIKHNKIKFTKSYDPNLPHASLDHKLTRIIFDNLLSNAIKYAPVGGKVTLGISVHDPNFIIKVFNDGPGIPKNAQKLIFTKMFRDDLARQKDPDGNGLGLYIVKSILNSSGGNIWFDSDEKTGTTFYVSLPLAGMKGKTGSKNIEQ